MFYWLFSYFDKVTQRALWISYKTVLSAGDLGGCLTLNPSYSSCWSGSSWEAVAQIRCSYKVPVKGSIFKVVGFLHVKLATQEYHPVLMDAC